MLSRHELLDHTHTLAHYIEREWPLRWASRRAGQWTVLRVAVEADRYWRLMSQTQEMRDAVRRGRYSGVLASNRPIALERYDSETTRRLLQEHIVLGDMLADGERLFIWTRGAMTGRGEWVDIRRYAYVPEEFRRRADAAGIVVPSPAPTTKRDQRGRTT